MKYSFDLIHIVFMILFNIVIDFCYGFTKPETHVALASVLWVLKRMTSASSVFKRMASAMSSPSYGYLVKGFISASWVSYPCLNRMCRKGFVYIYIQ